MTIRKPAIALALFASCACADPSVGGSLPSNWPASPSEIERRFTRDDFKIIEVKDAGAGVTGALRFKLQYSDATELKVKWKPMPSSSLDGWNNSPRKEMAAYAIQRWINDEDDYLVPTIAPTCIPLAEYKKADARARPSVRGSHCVLGVIAIWLENVITPDEFYDPKRFASDPPYARSMADFNLLTYLFEHRDGRQGNLLISTVPGDPRVFAIDNGIAFDPFPWNFLVPNWYKIRVPWLNRGSVERLRKIDHAQLEALGVVAQLEGDQNGHYRAVTPGPNLDDRDGVRRSGNRVQFGLTRDEIEELSERIEKLLARVDSGAQPVR